MKYRHSGLTYPGFDGAGNFHLMFSLFPTDMLQVNILFRDFDKKAEIDQRFAKAQVYASYKIEEVGTVRFAWRGLGGLGKKKEEGSTGTVVEGDPVGDIFLHFYSNEIVQGLAFEAGVQLDLPHVDQSDTYDGVRFGLGVNLTSTDPFNLKVRTGFMLAGQSEGKAPADVNNGKTADFGWTLGLLPSYKLPKMTIFFHAGFGVENIPGRKNAEGDDEEMVTEWFINPYIWVPMGGMRMWVGIQILDKHSQRDGLFEWNIPFGFNFYF
jgi:hypothetical protein